MVMELVQGGELFHLLHGAGDVDNCLPVPQARFYAACVLDVWDYLHGSGWLYRDLKPENLLIDSDGYIKVIDFGFAKRVAAPQGGGMGGRTFTFLGTPEYMAPELVKRTGYGQGADYWALGCLICEMLAGSTPFLADTTPAIYKRILSGKVNLQPFDAGTREVLSGLLEKNEFVRFGVDGGAKALKKHAWFADVDWEKLVKRELPPPWVPDISDKLDLHHFDQYDSSEEQLQVFGGDTSWSNDF